MGLNFTAWLIGVVAALLAAYDVWAYLNGNTPRFPTVTRTVQRARPVYWFLAGVLVGHLFFQF